MSLKWPDYDVAMPHALSMWQTAPATVVKLAQRRTLEAWVRRPRPFLWTASVATILTKVQRGNAILETLH